MEFEWDAEKAHSNLSKHGVPFEYVTRIFLDADRIEEEDETENYTEVRFRTIGMIEGRLFVVAYTYRGETIRIISARQAELHEKRKYHEI